MDEPPSIHWLLSSLSEEFAGQCRSKQPLGNGLEGRAAGFAVLAKHKEVLSCWALHATCPESHRQAAVTLGLPAALRLLVQSPTRGIRLRSLHMLQWMLNTPALATRIAVISSGVIRALLVMIQSRDQELQEGAWGVLHRLPQDALVLEQVRGEQKKSDTILHLLHLLTQLVEDASNSCMCRQESSFAIRQLTPANADVILHSALLAPLVQALLSVPLPTCQASKAGIEQLCEQATIVNLTETLAMVAESSWEARDQLLDAGMLEGMAKLLGGCSCMCQQAVLQAVLVMSWGAERHRDAIVNSGSIVPLLVRNVLGREAPGGVTSHACGGGEAGALQQGMGAGGEVEEQKGEKEPGLGEGMADGGPGPAEGMLGEAEREDGEKGGKGERGGHVEAGHGDGMLTGVTGPAEGLLGEGERGGVAEAGRGEGLFVDGAGPVEGMLAEGERKAEGEAGEGQLMAGRSEGVGGAAERGMGHTECVTGDGVLRDLGLLNGVGMVDDVGMLNAVGTVNDLGMVNNLGNDTVNDVSGSAVNYLNEGAVSLSGAAVGNNFGESGISHPGHDASKTWSDFVQSDMDSDSQMVGFLDDVSSWGADHDDAISHLGGALDGILPEGVSAIAHGPNSCFNGASSTGGAGHADVAGCSDDASDGILPAVISRVVHGHQDGFFTGVSSACGADLGDAANYLGGASVGLLQEGVRGILQEGVTADDGGDDGDGESDDGVDNDCLDGDGDGDGDSDDVMASNNGLERYDIEMSIEDELQSWTGATHCLPLCLCDSVMPALERCAVEMNVDENVTEINENQINENVINEIDDSSMHRRGRETAWPYSRQWGMGLVSEQLESGELSAEDDEYQVSTCLQDGMDLGFTSAGVNTQPWVARVDSKLLCENAKGTMLCENEKGMMLIENEEGISPCENAKDILLRTNEEGIALCENGMNMLHSRDSGDITGPTGHLEDTTLSCSCCRKCNSTVQSCAHCDIAENGLSLPKRAPTVGTIEGNRSMERCGTLKREGAGDHFERSAAKRRNGAFSLRFRAVWRVVRGRSTCAVPAFGFSTRGSSYSAPALKSGERASTGTIRSFGSSERAGFYTTPPLMYREKASSTAVPADGVGKRVDSCTLLASGSSERSWFRADMPVLTCQLSESSCTASVRTEAESNCAAVLTIGAENNCTAALSIRAESSCAALVTIAVESSCTSVMHKGTRLHAKGKSKQGDHSKAPLNPTGPNCTVRCVESSDMALNRTLMPQRTDMPVRSCCSSVNREAGMLHTMCSSAKHETVLDALLGAMGAWSMPTPHICTGMLDRCSGTDSGVLTKYAKIPRGMVRVASGRTVSGSVGGSSRTAPDTLVAMSCRTAPDMVLGVSSRTALDMILGMFSRTATDVEPDMSSRTAADAVVGMSRRTASDVVLGMPSRATPDKAVVDISCRTAPVVVLGTYFRTTPDPKADMSFTTATDVVIGASSRTAPDMYGMLHGAFPVVPEAPGMMGMYSCTAPDALGACPIKTAVFADNAAVHHADKAANNKAADKDSADHAPRDAPGYAVICAAADGARVDILDAAAVGTWAALHDVGNEVNVPAGEAVEVVAGIVADEAADKVAVEAAGMDAGMVAEVAAGLVADMDADEDAEMDTGIFANEDADMDTDSASDEVDDEAALNIHLDNQFDACAIVYELASGSVSRARAMRAVGASCALLSLLGHTRAPFELRVQASRAVAAVMELEVGALVEDPGVQDAFAELACSEQLMGV